MRQTGTAENASFTAAIFSILSSLTLNDVAMIVGIVTAVLTALYARQRRAEERREHLIRMRELEGKCGHGE